MKTRWPLVSLSECEEIRSSRSVVYDSSFVHSPAEGLIARTVSVHKHACRQGRNCRLMAWRVTEKVNGNHLSSWAPLVEASEICTGRGSELHG